MGHRILQLRAPHLEHSGEFRRFCAERGAPLGRCVSQPVYRRHRGFAEHVVLAPIRPMAWCELQNRSRMLSVAGRYGDAGHRICAVVYVRSLGTRWTTYRGSARLALASP
jgi:hypothetical protein